MVVASTDETLAFYQELASTRDVDAACSREGASRTWLPIARGGPPRRHSAYEAVQPAEEEACRLDGRLREGV